MNVRSAWLLNSSDSSTGQSRQDTRLSPLGTMNPTGPLTSRGGVIPGSPDGKTTVAGLSVYGDTAGMTAKVAPGRAVVQGNVNAGTYPVALSEPATVTLGDGDPANPRIDLVVLRVYDAEMDTSNRTDAVVEVVPGTPAAAPAAPPVPTAAVPLAQIRVRAGASAGNGGIDWKTDVTDRRPVTVAVGGILPADVTAPAAGAYPGQYRDNGGSLERWNGTAWTAYPPAPPVWQSFTPLWGAENGDQPKLNNGVAQGRYIKDGLIVHFRAKLTVGSTSTWAAGNGNWYLTLPVRPAEPTPAHFWARLGAKPVHFFGGCEVSTIARDNQPVPAAHGWSTTDVNGIPASDWADASFPVAPVAGNWYVFWGTYEAAA
ncbi:MULTISPECIES: hypothetical protein [Streptomyces]|uniref:hypothetical protein n=1 Tax=Streptomyces TaxID=1883 RepID=UPI00163C23A3|nr:MULTISPECIES: hypothetical protein [Streptomyces]MBC2877434.1 hypothetical protein [Streptomyces sp. TYQ1024]UBI38232.1 hypothetical protein K7I03_18420 [Streptomyces mobaraensis]UKW30818.1 hypothetical protein MCU78_18380 [Streptomyces sp. TYQ1024]